METRANYVLIGASAILGIVIALGFFVWLAKFQIDRQYAYYDVMFDNVSGLSRASDVRFSGLSVGQVVSLDLAENQSGAVSVRVQVAAGTPIHQGATAQLQSQGVTGTSVVAINAGDPDKPLLRTSTDDVPVIEGERSVVQSLAADAPDLLAESIKLVKEFQVIIGRENQSKVASILANVDQASGAFDAALTDFSSISRSVASATDQISDFTDKLQPLALALTNALAKAETTLVSVSGAFDQAGTTLGTADVTLKTIDGAATAAGDLIRNDGTVAVGQIKDSVDALHTLIGTLGAQVTTVLAAYGGTATEATARLTEMQTTLANLDTAIGGATTALASVELGGDELRHAGRWRRHRPRVGGADDVGLDPGLGLGDREGRGRRPAADHDRGAPGVDHGQHHRRPGLDRRDNLHRRPRPSRGRGGDDARCGNDDLPERECRDRPARAGHRLGRAYPRRRAGRLHRGRADHQ